MTVSPWMNAGISAFLLSFIGMSTGGILTSSVFKLSGFMSARLVMVSVGLLLSIIFLEILPESIDMGGTFQTLSGSCMGYLFARLSDQYVHRLNKRNSSLTIQKSEHSLIWLILAMTLHNLPIGLALGAGLQGAQLQSMHEHLMMAMIIHSIPEGLAVGLLLVAAGYRLSFLFSTFILINAPILIGSAIGNSLNEILDSSTISLFISVALGTLVFVIIHEIFYRINS